MEFSYKSLSEIADEAEKLGMSISELVLIEQASVMECTKEEVLSQMEKQYDVMIHSILEGIQPDIRSTSGLTGGDAFKMRKVVENNQSLTGSFLSSALMRALAVSEVNASMGRIVACPTAGSCGIVPAAVYTMQEERKLDKMQCVMSLLTASAVGMVISKNASLSGAQGGCQAECGSASAMAAAALVELGGGTPKQCLHAAAIAIKCVLGLVCDPVAGLVEVPCVKRNASGVANAIMAAELALAGIESVIPVDEVVDAMREVGNQMSSSLKETAEGGLAATPTAERLSRKIYDNK